MSDKTKPSQELNLILAYGSNFRAQVGYRETKAYKEIPQILSFADESDKDNMKQVVEANYRQVKADVVHILESEIERIKNDPDLQHLIQEE
ncbi:hypothetical protein [Sphingobacterium psychroaquaticum]|uniref:hypothetical protein n=1 Tax=Sphingobacterium psychroaquaticum TaxID=561061 RepID=UPI001F0DB34C|nr:hypothetical protein [Sphingobacterium psychroaquaticum]